MKRDPDFLLHDVAGTHVVVPTGAAVVAFPGMITVNDTGAYLWELLETEQTVETLAAALQERYEVGLEQAMADVKAFLAQLQSTGAVID